MFEKKTVFILGAGASWHYNQPTGEDLVKDVRDKAEELIKRLRQKPDRTLYHGQLVEFLANKFRGDSRQFNTIDFLQDFIDRLTHVDPPVIDYFLEWNEDLRSIGQMMIAWMIIDREREYVEKKCNKNRQRLVNQDPFRNINGRSIECEKFKDNWYRFVLYKMLSGCASPDQVADNNVKFVTFNYDVSLESYLYKGLKQIKFMKPGEISADAAANILQDRFFHMYGKIRKNPFVDPVPVIEDTRAYEDDYKQYADVLDKIYNASQDIRTIGNNKDDPVHDAVKAVIKDAEDVYILGYGFDQENSKRLGLEDSLSATSVYIEENTNRQIDRKVYFTNFGDINTINKKASKIFAENDKEFLKDYIYYGGNPHDPSRSNHFYEKSTRNVYDALANDFGLIE